jgi:hypothetical protein
MGYKIKWAKVMDTEIMLDSIYMHSQDVVAREIEGELIIIPLTSGIGDIGDEIYTLNETGRAIWQALDGKKSLQEVITSLEADYEAKDDAIEMDVQGLVAELLRRKMLVSVTR